MHVTPARHRPQNSLDVLELLDILDVLDVLDVLDMGPRLEVAPSSAGDEKSRPETPAHSEKTFI
jgi:hypothetical protein